MSEEFRVFMKTTRERKKLSYRRLAEKSGLSFSYLQQLETGRKNPARMGVGPIMQLARALDVPFKKLCSYIPDIE